MLKYSHSGSLYSGSSFGNCVQFRIFPISDFLHSRLCPIWDLIFCFLGFCPNQSFAHSEFYPIRILFVPFRDFVRLEFCPIRDFG